MKTQEQIDLLESFISWIFEMSFVEQEDIFNEIEPVIYEIFDEYSKKKVSSTPF